MAPAPPLPNGLREGDFAGLPTWLIDTPLARAAISRFGGQLLSFAPAGHDELLWLSPALKPLPAPIRGGVPLCWPWFGREGGPADGPAHGHARTAPWQLAEATREEDDTLALTFVPAAALSAGLELRQTLRLGTALEQALHTRNTGTAAVELTQALHSYFRVGDVRRATVTGLDGLDYADKLDGGATHRQHGGWTLLDPRDPGRCDRVYAGFGGCAVLHDPVLGRRIELCTRGSRTLVVWNPGADAARGFTDIPDEDWAGFLCLEAANAGTDRIVLAPGAEHMLAQRVTVLAGA